METGNNIRRHCPEVEELMGGRMPFVTRYGITLVVIVLAVVVGMLFVSGGQLQQFIREMIDHTVKQINANTITGKY